MTTKAKGQRHPIRFTLNGKAVSGDAEPRMLLTDFLRYELGVTGIHVGCEHGVCGACTIRLDGKAVRGCLTYAVQVDGREVKTVEALAGDGGKLSALQEAFRRHHALQCGYCTPGILMSLDDFLERNPKPTDDEIRDVIGGHLCRCTGYVGMMEAVRDVVGKDE